MANTVAKKYCAIEERLLVEAPKTLLALMDSKSGDELLDSPVRLQGIDYGKISREQVYRILPYFNHPVKSTFDESEILANGHGMRLLTIEEGVWFYKNRNALESWWRSIPRDVTYWTSSTDNPFGHPYAWVIDGVTGELCCGHIGNRRNVRLIG